MDNLPFLMKHYKEHEKWGDYHELFKKEMDEKKC